MNSNINTPEFTESEWNLRSIGRGDITSISYKVSGFWSSDSLRVYVTRDYFGADKAWRMEISRSSGGRDTKEESDEAVAAVNYASALIRAASVVRTLRTHIDELNAFYEEYKAELEAAHTAEVAAQAARLAADPAVSADIASAFLSVAVAKAKTSSTGWYEVKDISLRASDITISISVSYEKAAVFRMNGDRMSRADLVKYMSLKVSASNKIFS